MKTNSIKLPILAAVTLVSLAAEATAAVTIVNSSISQTNASGGAFSVNWTPTAAGNVLVAGAYADTSSGMTSITFGGNAADGSISDGRQLFAYYEATGTSEITVTGAAPHPNIALFVYELSGVDLSAGVATSTSAMITTTVDDSLVLTFGAANTPGSAINLSGGTLVEGFITVTGDDFDNFETGTGTGGQLSTASGTVGSAGSYTANWSFTGGTGGAGRTSFAFAPAEIPEPSVISLLGFAMFGFLLRRRR